ncbi:small ubiquitin-related modifier 2 [Senna tora]|uniref:Small ubiquitin-related modifier n=1 Tax=Senna tora TaxID=362788 RepID=A0A834X3I7_9FABA|nr:small ubiquitin-related modifier 2 [Senna tora]
MASSSNVEPNDQHSADDKISISIKGQDGRELFYQVRRYTQLIKVMRSYCDRRQLQFETIRFIYRGKRLRPTQTPTSARLKDGAQIDAMRHQEGGGWNHHHIFQFHQPN